MTVDLEQTLRRMSGSPEHAAAFDEVLWAAVARVDEEIAAKAEPPVAAPSAAVRRIPARRWWVALAAAVAVIAAALIATSTRHVVQQYREPPVASAATIVARVRHSLGSFRTLEATVVTLQAGVSGPDRLKPGWTSADWFARAHVDSPVAPVSDPKRILATAEGSLRTVIPVTGAEYSVGVKPDGTVDVARVVPDDLVLDRDVPAEAITTVDGRTGELGWYTPGYTIGGGSGGMSVEQAMLTKGRPLGYPDLDGFSSSWLTTEGLPVSVLSVLARGEVSAGDYDGRPALIVSAPVTPGPAIQGSRGEMTRYGEFDQIELTVDEATWFPMRYRTLLHGDAVQDVRLKDVRLDVPVTDGEFTPPFPEGAKVEIDDEGFRRVTPQEAARTFAYAPLGAGDLPEGFGYSATAVARRSLFFIMTGPGDAEHEFWRTTHDVTQVEYRAGFLSFTVTTRPAAEMRDPLLADPFARDPGAIATRGPVRTVRLRSGSLRGVQAMYAVPSLAPPHLWAFHDGLLVTVSGDLTKGQLLRAAESLEPLR